MNVSRRWNELSGRTRALILTGAAVDVSLRIAALADLRRRDASRIRGRKRAWALAVAAVNSFGVVPLSYFALGRTNADGPPRAGEAAR